MLPLTENWLSKGCSKPYQRCRRAGDLPDSEGVFAGPLLFSRSLAAASAE